MEGPVNARRTTNPRRLYALATLIVLVASLVLLPGCDWLRQKLGMPKTIADPEKETPDWVVQRVLEAATKEPFDQAFGEYSKYLHSSEKNSPQGMREWETLRFPALRRKHTCYLKGDEDDKFAYERMELRENRDDYVVVFVKCKTSDMPTPCHLFKDPEEGGKWRVKMNCLN